MNDSISALVWTVSTLLLGYLVLLLLKKVDTYWNDQSSKRKPEAPPRPEYTPEFKEMEFPDGTKGEISIRQYCTNFRHDPNQYRGVGWTPPMKELFLLITQDYSNWEHTVISPPKDGEGNPVYSDASIEIFFSEGSYTQYRHKTLDIKVYERHRSFEWDTPCRCSLSLTGKQTSFVIAQAKCWRDVAYGEKLRRIENIKECKRKRILLENQQKEATMITQYLENKGK